MNRAPMTYKGHQYIKVVGDARTPVRMWNVALYTAAEYENLPAVEKAATRLITEADEHLLNMHFDN